MSEVKYPPWYAHLKEKHGAFVKALEQLGESIRQEGPLAGKNRPAYSVSRGGRDPVRRFGAQPHAPGFAERRHSRRNLSCPDYVDEHHRLSDGVRGLKLGL